MKVIVVMGNITDAIVNNLNQTYPSIEVQYKFSTLNEMVNTIKNSPVKVDKIIFSDNALSVEVDESNTQEISDNLVMLKELLVGKYSTFFKCKEVIHLNKANHKQFKEYTDFIFEDIPIRFKHYYYNDILDISTYILGSLDETGQAKPTYQNVIRRKIRGQKDYKIESKEEDGRQIIQIIDNVKDREEYNEYLTRKQELSKASKEIEIDLSDEDKLDELTPADLKDINPLDLSELQKQNELTVEQESSKEIIVVVGGDKSGASVTALTVAQSVKSHHTDRKVLLIDIKENLGLSYLCEKSKGIPLSLIPLNLVVKNLPESVERLKQGGIGVIVNTLEFNKIDNDIKLYIYSILLDNLDFDTIVIDIGIQELQYFKPLLDTFKSNYIITFSRNLTSVVETCYSLVGMMKDEPHKVYLPIDNFNRIRSLPALDMKTLILYVNGIMGGTNKILATLRIKDTTVDSSLYMALNEYFTQVRRNTDACNIIKQ